MVTRDTQRKTLIGLTIPELLLIFALIGGVVGGVNFLQAQAREQVTIHNDAANVHLSLTSRVVKLESEIEDIKIWMHVEHPKEVNRAISEITANIKAELHKP